jgi:dihydrofolate reductase
MRRLVLLMSVSLDGFAARSDGNIDWLTPPGPGSGARRHRGNLEFLGQVDTIVLGRGAYAEMWQAWQSSDSPMAELINSLPKIVFSSSLEQVEWTNATLAKGAMIDEISALKNEPGRDIVCFGGARFAHALAAARLIDEYRLTIHPVALGEGLPLLHGLPEPQRLELVSATAYTDGSVVHEYTPA